MNKQMKSVMTKNMLLAVINCDRIWRRVYRSVTSLLRFSNFRKGLRKKCLWNYVVHSLCTLSNGIMYNV